MKNSEQPAYPPNAGWEHSEVKGLSKREYFAAMAMQGLLASGLKVDNPSYNYESSNVYFIAAKSLEYADHLLHLLSEKPTP